MMLTDAAPLLLTLLRDPTRLADLTQGGWDALLRAASSTGLLHRLAEAVEEAGLRASIPSRALRLLDNARLTAEAKARALRYEASLIDQALAGFSAPCLRLDEAAEDALILCTPLEQVDALAARLAHADWRPVSAAAEAEPPRSDDRLFVHGLRGHRVALRDCVLASARHDHVTALFFESAAPIADSHFSRLSAVDDLLADAFALFDPRGARHPLARLAAIALSIDGFDAEPGLWEGVVPRAQRLGLTGALYHALAFAARIANAPVPAHVMADALRVAEFGPLCWAVPWAAPHLMLSTQADRARRRVALAHRVLTIRADWQRRKPRGFLRA